MLIDECDAGLFAGKRFFVTAEGYAMCGGELVHRAIMRPGPGLVVDHINGNKLDNRRSNLRVCTRAQNHANKKPSRRNTSGVTGVCFDKRMGRWKATIPWAVGKGRQFWFTTLEEAAEFRQLAEELVHGKFAFHLSRK